MPIANCIVTPECQQRAGNTESLIEAWADASGVSPEEMTLNVVVSHAQLGNRYGVMATLYLPSLWSSSEVSSIQLGLAQALVQHYGVSADSVHVITHMVESGRVVESGEEVKW